jgi:hypothetical protein
MIIVSTLCHPDWVLVILSYIQRNQMTSQIDKPLSEKPLGYLLAVLGGTLGAPVGWITSPIVLLILNNVIKKKGEKQPNRFLVWGLIGIIGAPISLAPVISNMNTGSNPTSSSTAITPSSTPEPADTSGVNMENYGKLQTGMTYEEVVAILGKQGEEMSSNDIGGYTTVMYKWDGDTGFGANMNAMFQNGKLIQKAQFGLK